MTYDASLGYDDAMPDAYDSWVGGMDANALMDILYGNKRDLHKVVDAFLWEHFAEHVYPSLKEGTEE